MAKNSEKEGKSMGKGQFANMPQEVKMKAYPKASEAGPGDLDDTMIGIDRANSKAASKTRSNLSNQH